MRECIYAAGEVLPVSPDALKVWKSVFEQLKVKKPLPMGVANISDWENHTWIGFYGCALPGGPGTRIQAEVRYNTTADDGTFVNTETQEVYQDFYAAKAAAEALFPICKACFVVYVMGFIGKRDNVQPTLSSASNIQTAPVAALADEPEEEEEVPVTAGGIFGDDDEW